MALANKFERASATARKFTLEYLEQITNNFSEEHVIGRGAYGVVYKGVLENGEVIALRKLCWRPDTNDTEFSTEFNNLMRVQHPNITRLVGYCYHQGHELIEHKGEYIFPHVEERVLCFEYLKGGSLDKKISDESCGLDWHTRFKIINGVSLGLHYLHNGSKDSIYHLDLKPANILLDKNMVPKIGDFGLSRLFPSAQTIITNKNIGTRGYMPPEYIDKGEITSKHDVFSLGVIIIRIMAGDEGYFKSAHMSSQEFLELVHENWRKRLQATMLSHTSDQIETCIKIALRCVEVDRNKRPTIAEIVNELNKHIHIADGDAKGGKVTSAEKTSEDVCTPKLASVPLTPLHVNSQPAHTEEPYMQPQVPDQIIVKPLQRRWLSSWCDQIIVKISDLAGLAVVLAALLRPLAVALAVYLVARIAISSVAYLVVSSVAYLVARIVISSVANLVARIALSSAGCFISGLVVCFILTRLEAATYLGSVVQRIRHRTLPYAEKAVLGCFVLGLVVNFPNAYFVLGLVVGFCCTEHWVAFPATYFLLGLVVRSIPRTLPTAYFILGFVVSFILTAVTATTYLGSVVERARRQIIVPYPKTILLGCFLLGSVVSFPNAYCVLGLVVGLCSIKHWVALPTTYFLLGLVVGSFLTTLPTAYFILDLVASFILLYWVTSSYVGFISWPSVLQN